MTASATERDACEETEQIPHLRLRIDYSTFEAFQYAARVPCDTPRIVRWFDCFARAEDDQR
jgi:hypothetical protein